MVMAEKLIIKDGGKTRILYSYCGCMYNPTLKTCWKNNYSRKSVANDLSGYEKSDMMQAVYARIAYPFNAERKEGKFLPKISSVADILKGIEETEKEINGYINAITNAKAEVKKAKHNNNEWCQKHYSERLTECKKDLYFAEKKMHALNYAFKQFIKG